jgi:hypothetical protein
MSLYMQWLNAIKEGAEESWLTPRQSDVYVRLTTGLASQSFVNVYGPPGSGKSFVGRLLAKECGYAFAFDLHEVAEGSEQVVLDDAKYARAMRPLCRERNLGRMILLTEQPVREAMARVELCLQPRDVLQFRKNLSNHCGIDFIATVPEGTDLGEMLRREAVERGRRNVAS